jgi:signal recognition particle subunit SRP54
MFDSLTKRLTGIFSKIGRRGYLTESEVYEVLREVRVALLEADVHFQVAKQFVADLQEAAVGAKLYESLDAEQTIIKIVRDELIKLLGTSEVRFQWSSSPPTVVLLCGLQGSGKTTTAAKLAKWLLKQGKKPMLAACDTQRPAAITQLEILGEQVGVPVYSKKEGTPPPKIAEEALARCRYLLGDVLIVDTAGRLSIDEPLMRELEEIQRITNPIEKLLVLDASTGQEAVHVAQTFHERLHLTGTIFTKLDGDTRGGAVLSVNTVVGVPVRFIGIGEQVDALDVFYPDRMAQRILGMGDILGLIEKVEKAVNLEDVMEMRADLRSRSLNFNDLLNQLRTIRKMGSFKSILNMIPGLGSRIPAEALNNIDEKQFSKIEAIIQSMTPRERAHPEIINGSRRRRIASGSGTSVEEINRLLKQLQEMQKNLKHLMKMEKKFQKFAKRR